MNKNLEELKKNKDILTNWESIQIIVKILEDFENRLTELEKDKINVLEHQEINETGGVNNIKIIFNDPN